MVLRAIQCIERELSDPKLTVNRVAQSLSVNGSYLSHLFVEEVGERMGRFIVGQRIERSKILLATTDLQIKRIARDTGYANPSWFAYVFRSYAGTTPAEYRAQSRRPTA